MASDLARDNVGLADLVPPVSSPHGDSRELGHESGPTDGSGSFLGILNTHTDMPIVVPSGDKCLALVCVCFCTGIIFETLGLRDGPRKKAVLPDS